MSVGLAALLISAVTVNMWAKTKGENIHRLNFYTRDALMKLKFTLSFSFSKQTTKGKKDCEYKH